jgi:hypothetical protein
MKTRLGWSFASASAILAVAMMLGTTSFGWDDPPSEGPADVELLNPNGKWSGFEVGKTRGVHLFHDPANTKGWRLLITKPSGPQARRVKGTITPVGGTVVSLEGMARSEFGKKARKKGIQPDIGYWDPQGIKFDFGVNGGVDKIDFQLSPETKYIKVELSVPPPLIRLGRAGAHPRKSTFLLPAHPKFSR